MMNRIVINSIMLYILLLLPSVLRAQQLPQIPVSARQEVLGSVLERDSILIGDQVWWEMDIPEAKWKNAQIETAGISPLPFQITQGVEALSPVKLDSVFRKKRLEGIRARILLTSFDSGSYQLPHMPLYLKRIDGAVDTLWFSGPDLYVNTIQVDTTSFQAFGLKPQMRYPLTLSEILGAAGILFFLAALVWLIVWIVKRRRKNLPVFGLSRKKDPPHVAALRALDAIKAQELWKKQKVKQYYTLLTDTVRVYMRDRWGIQAMEQTSAEMIASLQRKEADDTLLTDKIIQVIGNMLYTGDLAKFAKYTPSDPENEESLQKAVRFVTETALYENDKEEKEE